MIRKAKFEEIPALLKIFSNVKGIMRESGNMNQWNDSYPSEEIIRKDIEDGHCIVLCEETGRDRSASKIIATMAFIPGPDPTYAVISDGAWPDDEPYYVIHRIAVAEPGHNAAKRLFDWAFTQADTIRIDTHKDNVIMHHVLGKYGFDRCGIIYLADGQEREAYQMCKK